MSYPVRGNTRYTGNYVTARMTSILSNSTLKQAPKAVSRNQRPKTSGIWQFAADLDSSGNASTNKHGEKVYRCQICINRGRLEVAEYLVTAGNYAFRRHLRKMHKIEVNTRSETANNKHSPKGRKLTDLAGWDSRNTPESRRNEEDPDSGVILTKGQVRAQLLNWITHSQIPFSVVESDAFRQFMEICAPEAVSFIPTSHNTIRGDLERYIELRMPSILADLAGATSKIHVVFDGWTSSSNQSIFGLVYRYLDLNCQLNTLLLGLIETPESHCGEYLAGKVLEITERYQITKRLGFVVSDNASNMDSCAKDMEKQLTDAGYRWSHKYYRIRCLGHIIHLSATAFLFPTSDQDDHQLGERGQQNLTCFSKLHSIVKWVRSSPQRTARWLKLADKKLIQDNATRWHSYLDMCERALQPEIRVAILELTSSEKDLADDFLDPTDWENLEYLVGFFEPYRLWTKSTEGLMDSIDMVLPAFDTLMVHLEESATNLQDNLFMTNRIIAAWDKLKKYYTFTDDTTAYFAATVLNPTKKLVYFEYNWANTSMEVWIDLLVAKLKDIWTTNYKTWDTADGPQPTSWNQQTLSLANSAWSRFMNSQHMPNPSDDELSRYLAEPVLHLAEDVFGLRFRALDWWTSDEQQRKFPCLSRLAFDLLSIPPQSVEIERVFSSCKDTMAPKRARIKVGTLEKVQLYRSWCRNARKLEQQKLQWMAVTDDSTTIVLQ